MQRLAKLRIKHVVVSAPKAKPTIAPPAKPTGKDTEPSPIKKAKSSGKPKKSPVVPIAGDTESCLLDTLLNPAQYPSRTEHPIRSRGSQLACGVWSLQRDMFMPAFRSHVIQYGSHQTSASSIHFASPRQLIVAYHFRHEALTFWVAVGGYEGQIFTVGCGEQIRQWGTYHLTPDTVCAVRRTHSDWSSDESNAHAVSGTAYVTAHAANIGHYVWNDMSGLWYARQFFSKSTTVVWRSCFDCFELTDALVGDRAARVENMDVSVMERVLSDRLAIMFCDRFVPNDMRQWCLTQLGVPTVQIGPARVWVELRGRSALHFCTNQIQVMSDMINAAPDNIHFVIGGFMRWTQPAVTMTTLDNQTSQWHQEVLDEEDSLLAHIANPARVSSANRSMTPRQYVQACAACAVCVYPAGSGSTIPNILLNKRSIVHTNGAQIGVFQYHDRTFTENYDASQVTIVPYQETASRHDTYEIMLDGAQLWSSMVAPTLAR